MERLDIRETTSKKQYRVNWKQKNVEKRIESTKEAALRHFRGKGERERETKKEREKERGNES